MVHILSNYPDVLLPSEVQDILRIGRNKVYDLLRSGEIKSLRIGNKFIIPKMNLIDFLNAKPKEIVTKDLGA